MKAFRYLVLVIACGVWFVACGGSPVGSGSEAPLSTTEATTTTVVIDYAAQFLEILKPASDVLAANREAMNKISTPAEFTSVSEPYSVALESEAQALLKASWPESVRPNIETLAKVKIETSVLGKTAKSSGLSLSELGGRATDLAAKARAELLVIRAKLGITS